MKMLEKLRAREIPELYYKAHYLSSAHSDFNAHYNKDMVTHISKSKNSSPFLKTALEKAIEHNETTLEKLRVLIEESVKNGCYRGDNWMRELYFSENGNIVSFRDILAVTGVITNIVNVSKKSPDAQASELIERLNVSYNNIRNMKIEGVYYQNN